MKSFLPPHWELFNLRHDEVEKDVSKREGSYQGLKEEALYTSDEDLLAIFSHPLIEGTFCDLGSGHGKAPILYAWLYPDRESIGIEFEKARLEIGEKFKNSLNLKNISLWHDDLLKVQLPKAQVYFLYFPTGYVLDKVLTNLYEMKESFRLVVIESHGDLISRIELENWLELRAEIPLHSVRYYPFARIYQKTDKERSKNLVSLTYSYQEKFIFLNDEEWIGETFQMTWIKGQNFDLHTPPRTISWKDVTGVKNLVDLKENERIAVNIRRMGEVEIKTHQKSFKGYIRKIITKPTFRLELSSGEKVEWSEIESISQGKKICYESSQRS